MKKNRSSKTALDVLAARAVNSIAPRNMRIIHDRYAARFLPGHWLPVKIYFRMALTLPFLYWLPRFIANQIGIGADILIALRHRFIDDQLKEHYRKGIRQVVLLGAGYDSRALRFRYPGLRFIEIDHPMTQKRKVKLIGGSSIRHHDALHFIPVDFCTDWLKTVAESGMIHNVPTLYIWEGVSYYLPCEAVTYTLEGVKKLTPAGSSLVFDFFPKELVNRETADVNMKRMQRYGAARWEDFLWGCDREDIDSILGRHGFHGIQTTSMLEFARYLNESLAMRIPIHDILDYMVLAEAVSL
jgi:methyltransferase (TIGR00027 family)